MKGLASVWQRLDDRLQQHSLRERVLILLCILGLIIALWQVFIELPLAEQRHHIATERASLGRQSQALAAQQAALVSREPGDEPHSAAARELIELESQRAALDERLAGLSQGLVSADQLPEVLREVLVSTTRLHLERLHTLPVEPLSLPTSAAGSADAEARNPDSSQTLSPGVYRHSVELRVRGEYFGVLAFLQRLESLPWRFYWDLMEYEVETYPRGQVRLRVYTLSAEEGLLGV